MPTTATCELNQFQSSGIQGRLTLSQSDDGSMLTVRGEATGFGLLGGVYVSLAYGLGSNAQLDPFDPARPPCADDRSFDIEPPPIGGNDPGDVIFSPVATARMLLGVWGGVLGVPVLGDRRTLDITKATTSPIGVRLDQIKTISIREATFPDVTNLNILRDIRPQLFKLRACGLIVPSP